MPPYNTKWPHGFSPKKYIKGPKHNKKDPKHFKRKPKMTIKALLSFLGSFLYFFRGKTVGQFLYFLREFLFLVSVF
jgi:hypothetical protein